MASLQLLLEAERRGILPEDKKGLLAEARRRGLVGGGQQVSPPSEQPKSSGPLYGSDMPMAEVSHKESEPYGRTALEGMGTLGGAAVGSFLFPGPGTYAGEVAGYAGGSELGDYLYGKDTGSVGRKVAEGTVFSLAPAAISKGVSKLGRGAIRSALKIPPTQAAEKTASSAVETIIQENLRVSQGGVVKAKGIVNSLEKQMNKVLSQSGSSVDVDNIVAVIESQKPRFANSSDPARANKIIDKVIEKLRTHPNVSNGKIPIEKAQLMKKDLYKELDSFYKNAQALSPSRAIANQTESIAKASQAEAFRKEILSDPSIPDEAVDWLKREGNLLNALRWIQRRANVAANMDPITFNDVLLGGLLREGVPYAIATRIARTPWALSAAGVGMAKVGPSIKPTMQFGLISGKNYLNK